jgi:hypothetical protein
LNDIALRQEIKARHNQLRGAIFTAYKLRGQLLKLTEKKEY